MCICSVLTQTKYKRFGMASFGFGSKQKDSNSELTTRCVEWSHSKVYKICQENKCVYIYIYLHMCYV